MGLRGAEALGFVLDVNTLVAGMLCLATTKGVIALVVEVFDRWSRSYSGLICLAATLACIATLRMSGTRRAGEMTFMTFWLDADDIVNVS
jgi:hypothetical protein